jgi:hypothetical protein
LASTSRGRPHRQTRHDGRPRRGQGAEFFSKFVEDLFNMGIAAAQALAEQLAKKPPKHTGQFKILDIAAGSGVWSIPLAQRIPNSHITAVDFAKVLPVTRRVVERHQLADRLSTIEGRYSDPSISAKDFTSPPSATFSTAKAKPNPAGS